MARHKNFNWTLPDGSQSYESAQLAVLMDIRDELQSLNRTLNCHRVPAGMDALTRIDRRLRKHMKLTDRTNS